ncbi:Omp28-related outer membrane protein [Saprospiraceae bacterium]|nr:Omp28-related outer membrane protein [Saprospiraceae bacterium]
MKINLALLFIVLNYTISAQVIFLDENFDNCQLPTDWTLEHASDSHGWDVVSSDEISTTALPFPNNGNCFAANNDNKWDDGQNGNNAIDDQLLTPYLDLSSAEHLVISFDYLSPYNGGVTLYYRTDDTEDWTILNNFIARGGMLSWQKKTVYPFGHINAPMSTLQKPIQFMFGYSDFGNNAFLGLGIDNVKIFEPAGNDVVLEDVMVADVLPVGLQPIKAGLLNHGTNLIQSVNIKWQLDDGPVSEQNVSSFRISNGAALTYILPYGTGVIPGDDIIIDFENEGEFLLKVWAELPSGVMDNNTINNYWEKSITVKSNLPEKEYIYEKFSHNDCAPCYESDLLAEQIAEENENIHIVSLHQSGGDPMDYPEAREIDRAYSQRVHPGSIIDRRFLGHWEHATMSSLREHLPLFSTPWYSPAEVYFTKKSVNENEATVDLEISGKFVVDLDDEYRFNIWTLEDSIVAYQAGSPELNDYIHNHVLRNYTGGNYGQEGSLPLQVIAGEDYKYEATIDIDPSWDMNNLTFVAVIQRYELDSDQREIVNASVMHINDELIVSQDEFEEIELKIYPNPSSNFVHILLPKTNIKVNYSIYNNLGQQVAQQNLQTYAQNYIQLDVRNYAIGNYVIMLEIDGIKFVKNFVVN